ncbi:MULTISPECIES: sporulation killing factor system radical SAM maturase [Bacillus]|uniref:Sporulation killing factor system radical SAM maturase n=1 Tax=Bacillus pumilus TaxID=1408 RepID=A0A2G8IXT3_BACPU|nr:MULTISPECIES: sporulation killing factor system radical SAM maturase [Bacillus]MCC9089562.1 sporulation killing factor system radical SAM maturase [Bacillus pumilus]PIK28310.1 sporulation killing factor system radical SAM maturase [Bacillus pumilus]
MSNNQLAEYDLPELAIHLQPHGAVMIDRKSMYYFRLSGRGAQLAFLLSKNKDLRKTARIWEIVKKEELTADQLREELSAHPFTEAWTQGLLDQPIQFSGSLQSYLPISCTLQLTNACNLGCSFCYASSGKPYPEELTCSQWINVMQKLAAQGVADVTLTGGEAKLIRGFKEIVMAASSLFTNVNVFSNGLNWRQEEVELLSHLGNVSVQISIDGKSDTHDSLRGRKGAFQESMETIKQLAEVNVPVIVAMTINEMNADQVAEVVDHCAKANASIFRAGKTLSVGRATKNFKVLETSFEQRVQSQLQQARHKWGHHLNIIDWEHEESSFTTDFCTPGYLAWYIRADGYVTPCQLEDISLGHILTDSFSDIGSPTRLLELKCEAKNCKCIGKVELSEPDLPFENEMRAGITHE